MTYNIILFKFFNLIKIYKISNKIYILCIIKKTSQKFVKFNKNLIKTSQKLIKIICVIILKNFY